jgi:hypothetical protein
LPAKTTLGLAQVLGQPLDPGPWPASWSPPQGWECECRTFLGVRQAQLVTGKNFQTFQTLREDHRTLPRSRRRPSCEQTLNCAMSCPPHSMKMKSSMPMLTQTPTICHLRWR